MEKTGVYFIYDGDCPLCAAAVNAFRIQKEYGALHLINAREYRARENGVCQNKSRQHNAYTLMEKIAERNLNLDDGMVIYANNQFYHGKDALKFMAKYGEASNVLMRFCKSFFWSDKMSTLIYPWMRATRNWLLRRRSISQLDNLSKAKVAKTKIITKNTQKS